MESFKSHILVIDDDEGIRSLLKQFLNENGYLVNTASTASEAEEKISIPFWLGDRAFDFNNSQIDNRWNIGYENLDKDGYFIGRKINSIDINDDFTLDLEPQFLIQRSLKGHTKSL